MQHEIITSGKLLNAQGNLTEPGYAKSLILDYRRADIKAPWHRIKEWDYYYIGNADYGVALTVADNSYMGMASASLLDFRVPCEHTMSQMQALTRGRYKLPESSAAGITQFSDKRVNMVFTVDGSVRNIACEYENFQDGKTLIADIVLSDAPDESMVIATPFNKDKSFYYNQKINCMRASGYAKLGDKEYAFDPETSFATLDWGRGVWTYDNTWYWSSANGLHEGKRFGFNLGYGFGNTSAASENMLFYDGKAHKLNGVTFNIPTDSYVKPWTFTSDDGRLELDFLPVIDRQNYTSVGVILTDQHQVFGSFSGKAVLDDDTALTLKDIPGFAEKVRMKY